MGDEAGESFLDRYGESLKTLGGLWTAGQTETLAHELGHAWTAAASGGRPSLDDADYGDTFFYNNVLERHAGLPGKSDFPGYMSFNTWGMHTPELMPLVEMGGYLTQGGVMAASAYCGRERDSDFLKGVASGFSVSLIRPAFHYLRTGAYTSDLIDFAEHTGVSPALTTSLVAAAGVAGAAHTWEDEIREGLKSLGERYRGWKESRERNWMESLDSLLEFREEDSGDI